MTPPYASIGITTANTSYPVAFSDAYGKNYAECFFADDVNAHVEYKDDQKLYLVSGVVARPLTVTFDPNGGTLDEADKTRSVNTGERYGTLSVPSYAGYDFAGWYTDALCALDTDPCACIHTADAEARSAENACGLRQ